MCDFLLSQPETTGCSVNTSWPSGIKLLTWRTIPGFTGNLKGTSDPSWENKLFPAPLSPEQLRTSGQQGRRLVSAEWTCLNIYSWGWASQCWDSRQEWGVDQDPVDLLVYWRKIWCRNMRIYGNVERGLSEQRNTGVTDFLTQTEIQLESQRLQWQDEMSCAFKASKQSQWALEEKQPVWDKNGTAMMGYSSAAGEL